MKKLFSLASVILMAFVLSGCASVKRNYIPEVSNLDFPAVGVETTVFLGEEMLIQGKRLEGKAIKITSAVDGACYDIMAQKIPVVGEDADRYYLENIGVTKAALCDPVDGMFVEKDGMNKICVVTIFGGYACYDVPVCVDKIVQTSAEHIQRTLVFSGRKGNNLEFMYVERSGNQVLMTHNVSYDISKTSIVGYRGAKIKISNCSNESITYTVLENFPNR